MADITINLQSQSPHSGHLFLYLRSLMKQNKVPFYVSIPSFGSFIPMFRFKRGFAYNKKSQSPHSGHLFL